MPPRILGRAMRVILCRVLDYAPLTAMTRGRHTPRRNSFQRPGEARRLHRIIRTGAALPPTLATGVFVEEVRVRELGRVVRHSIEQVVVLKHQNAKGAGMYKNLKYKRL